jgi:DNA invertase Pin-like site-specific DNA recombinase
MSTAPAKPKLLRCALYTRKSSEEGLEQGFNSLDAQREAGAAYVLSQAREGWQALPTRYDDGGYSGGTMERPGLAKLLADIEHGKIDIVVVYKVDRLTRSLTDFARIVERFDAKGVSFVSVTQAFNTTTSMGRLTLNVLLSFAQFEREVTGERIRDKLAASKAKGMWMGGNLPLGYDKPTDPQTRALVVNAAEAETVRHIFSRYLELGSVHPLKDDRRRASSPSGGSRSAGAPWAGCPSAGERCSTCLATGSTSGRSCTRARCILAGTRRLWIGTCLKRLRPCWPATCVGIGRRSPGPGARRCAG